jgi:hypothetical protein
MVHQIINKLDSNWARILPRHSPDILCCSRISPFGCCCLIYCCCYRTATHSGRAGDEHSRYLCMRRCCRQVIIFQLMPFRCCGRFIYTTNNPFAQTSSGRACARLNKKGRFLAVASTGKRSPLQVRNGLFPNLHNKNDHLLPRRARDS